MDILYWFAILIYTIFLVLFGLSLLYAVFFKAPFVPSTKKVSKKLIEIADLKDGQIVYDLGSGDGRLVFEALKQHDIQAVGYENSPLPYLMANIAKLFRQSPAKFRFKNFFKEDLSKPDRIFLYLIPDIMPKLGEKLKKECKKDCLIISNTFKIPNMEPIKTIPKDDGYPTIYVYQT